MCSKFLPLMWGIDIIIQKLYNCIIMQRVVVQVPMTQELKEKAEIISSDLGFSSIQETIRVLLTKLSKREFNLRVEEVEEITYLSPIAVRKFKKAQEDIRNGRVSPSFDNANDAIVWLNNPKAKFQNGNKV